MNRPNPNRAAIFLIVLAIVAAILYLPIYHHQQRSAQTEEQRQIESDIAVQHRNYMARYLNSGFSRQANLKTIGLVAISENRELDSAISDALQRHLKADDLKFLPSLFKNEFVSDGLFADAFNGSSEICRDLELTNLLDGILLARETIDYSTNAPSLDNVITADMNLEIVVQAITTQVENHSWTFSATGAGIRQRDARSLAEERIIKQIMRDTNMTLSITK